MFGFDKMFDFNRDGTLDSLERAVQFVRKKLSISSELWINMPRQKYLWKFLKS